MACMVSSERLSHMEANCDSFSKLYVNFVCSLGNHHEILSTLNRLKLDVSGGVGACPHLLCVEKQVFIKNCLS